MEDYEILVSEPIDILAEWRCFIMYDRIIGQSRMVEANDAYALGCYGLPSLLYAKFIFARWSQIFVREN